MIARVWSARATRADAPRYLEYFRTHVLPELQAIPGYEGANALTRDIVNDAGGRAGAGDNVVEVVVITRWASLAAVRAFAGEPIDQAVVHSAAAALLIDYDKDVRHYAVEV
jgi:heme-degrading monooxygenase HmoA